MTADPYRILVAQGVGDSLWGLLKAQSIAEKHADGRPIEILVAGWDRSEIECRALPVLRRFPWVSSVRFFEMPKAGNMGPVLKPGPPTDELGRYRYLDSGKPPFSLKGEVDFIAIPNGHLEYGRRLEDWLPEYETAWGMFKDIDFHERCIVARDFVFTKWYVEQPNYVVFFLGALGANHPQGVAGHNHGALWRGDQWAELGDRLIKEMDTEIVVVGAGYDMGYYEEFVRPHITQYGKWHYRLGEFAFMETMAVCSQARAVAGYQSGVTILSHYLRVPKVVCWWRPDGNSIVKGSDVCFDEAMAHAWAYPDWKETGSYMPCIYGRESVEEIVRYVTS